MSWDLVDQRLAKYSYELENMGVPQDCLYSVASSIRDELLGIGDAHLRTGFSSDYPDAASIHDQVVQNWIFSQKHFELIYQDISVNHTAVIAANYLYFVYMQDSFLKAVLAASPKKGTSRAVAKFLTTGEVWSFRNAFAHGGWRYVSVEGDDFQAIEYRQDGKKDGEYLLLPPEKLQFWHLLSKTILGLWSARLADLRQPFSTTVDV